MNAVVLDGNGGETGKDAKSDDRGRPKKVEYFAANAFGESSQIDHQNMNEEEENQPDGGKKVNRTGRLLPANYLNKKWKSSSDGWGHCQAGPDQNWEQTKDDE